MRSLMFKLLLNDRILKGLVIGGSSSIYHSQLNNDSPRTYSASSHRTQFFKWPFPCYNMLSSLWFVHFPINHIIRWFTLPQVSLSYCSFSPLLFSCAWINLLFGGCLTISTRRRGLVSRAAWAMFTITVVAFLLSTLSWCSLLAGFIIKIEATFVNNIDQPLDRTLLIGVNHRLFLFNVLEEWPRQFLVGTRPSKRVPRSGVLEPVLLRLVSCQWWRSHLEGLGTIYRTAMGHDWPHRSSAWSSWWVWFTISFNLDFMRNFLC